MPAHGRVHKWHISAIRSGNGHTPDPEKYLELTRNKFGIGSFDAMLKFAGDVKRYVPSVTMTTVATTITEEEEERCRKICEDLGVSYRIRSFES